jgi:hypothetical protein
MADLLENVFNQHPDKSSVLNLIDEYTLYCFYLDREVEINEITLSPIRTKKVDEKPSFRIFYNRHGKLYWYDHGLGGKGGDIFDLVKILHSLDSFQDAILKINQDFELGMKGKFVAGKPLETLKPVARDPANIDAICHPDFSTEALQYWKAYNISREILAEYNVKHVRYILLDGLFKPADPLCFSYRIGQYLKIYQPYNKDHKFLNNYPSAYVEGLLQLTLRKDRKNNLLVITKSTKDVMCLRSIGIEAISPKAENTPIPRFLLEKLETEYKHIITFFDPDDAGERARARYPYLGLCLTPEPEVKDIADYMKKYGPEQTKLHLFQLICQHIVLESF